ncbi:ABC transporter substrate-binding protein [Pseudooceanicola sp. CBS1P-1]|uniref:ABC transporter substrate-binding protein n=1 Tax=Pseudooceanicola albus TaxID=2692189 RepID=A0A6L7G5A5_9RHOB|nr:MULTISPECIES: ABC transporter substrate-binding protein [Pseudooceanicola]MBT9385434.1 ABC transporter substrate-binding protein [Pseudooceanicola endophyticus]MXN18707.1 ABC transporter substrate-binding protein [Pseudooceanicola albus]
MTLTRRQMLLSSLSTVALATLAGRPAWATIDPVGHEGGTLTFVISPSPQILTSAMTTAGAEQVVSAKISDSLFTYDFDMNIQPQLATSYDVSEDGKTVTFHLRQGVKWHDGTPFTSRDVAYTCMKVWKVLHGRGRTIFKDVTEVQTPDDHTAVFVMTAPSPGMLKSLAAQQTQLLPAHLYEGTDPMTNPYNLKPVGTGPFKFVSFVSGDNLVLEKNEDYWDAGKPHLDKLVFRFVSDPATVTAGLESGEFDLVNQSLLPKPDLPRLEASGKFDITTKGYEFQNEMQMIEFNLDDPVMSNPKVREALAYAIDKQWLVDNVFFGYGKVANTPLHYQLTQLYDETDVPRYDYDPMKAVKLLEEAGYKRGTLELTVDPLPYGEYQNMTANYLREAFRGIGVKLTVRNEDFAGFVKRVYTDRDFQFTVNLLTGGSDPTIGTHRTYWSKSFAKGVGFSNGSHYDSPEMDKILEAASAEMDEEKRIGLYHAFQKLAMTDLPVLPLVAVESVTVANKRVHNHTINAHGTYADFAEVWVDPKA